MGWGKILNYLSPQQILQVKNSYSLDVDERNLQTNQLTASARVSRITDAENFALNTYEADYALKEFFGPRADDAVAKREMLQDIMQDGYTQQKNLTDDVRNKQTLNTVDVYFTGCGIKTDLVTSGLELKRTQDERELRDLGREKYEK